MLTPRQRAAYDFIESFGTRKGYAPSYDEIRRHLVPAPPNAKRWLEPVRGRAGRATLARRAAPGSGTAAGPSTIPLLGTIAAGGPIEPIETPEEIEVPASMLGTGERYALRVQGDSMIEDGIQDGDVVVVRRAQSADAGETVVAIVDGEATLKRFHPARGQVDLRPANAALEPIRVRADRVEIRGVLVGLFRRYAP
jgi:repressor LexA